MNKLVLSSSVALALALVSGVASAATVQYKASLNGAQEVPGNGSPATGTATLSFDTGTNALTGTVALTGLAATTSQHVHIGACGVSTANNVASDGTLPAPAAGIILVNITLNAAEATDLAASGLYINVHTSSFPNGEIRGQIEPQASAAVCPVDGGAPDSGADAAASDAGKDGGSSGSSGSSGTSGTSGTSGSSGTSGTSGATTTPADGGVSGPVDPGDSGGCSTTGTESSGSGLGLSALAVLGLALAFRARKKKS
jgi:MYXO-CTERM domain-containing protein